MGVDALMQPLKVGKLTLKNRFIMAPLTRCRAGLNHVPTPAMVKYYSDRASMGLIIAEATQIQEGYSAFGYEPGIYNKEQIEAWRKVTDAVHAKGGLIFCQIHHGGRSTAEVNLDPPLKVVAPSDVPIKNHSLLELFSRDGKKHPFPVPTPIKTEDIPKYVELFAQAARNAIEAGFDGVEVHSANGYLISQFFCKQINNRTDQYGGSIENRCRFFFEVIDAVSAAVGADRTSCRLSLINTFNDCQIEDAEELNKYICTNLNSRNIAFVDVLRSDFFSAKSGADKWARQYYKGLIFDGMRFEIDEANKTIADKEADAICFGIKALANPDLVERAVAGAELNAPDPSTFYTHDEKGYNDYPRMDQSH